jgi:hypothetical protein
MSDKMGTQMTQIGLIYTDFFPSEHKKNPCKSVQSASSVFPLCLITTQYFIDFQLFMT